jgi:hypothetical protein
MNSSGIEEELEHSICTIVIVCSDTNHQPSLAIDEGVDYDFPPNQAYN